MTRKPYTTFANVLKAMGAVSSVDVKILTKLKLTWHYLDGNLKGTMQLIKRTSMKKLYPIWEAIFK